MNPRQCLLASATLSGGLLATHSVFAEPWTPTSAPSTNWAAVAASADGTKLVAAVGGRFGPSLGSPGPIYTSTNVGATWKTESVAGKWDSVGCSADGNMLVAVDNRGGIWISQSTPEPALSMSPSGDHALVSWTVPSLDFVLQENSDLTTTNWSNVTNAPALNLTNLENQVMVPLVPGNRFYRLRH